MNKLFADDCCKEKIEITLCRVCGGNVDKNRTICDTCLSEERYQKGRKIKYSEYDLEWLYDDTTDRYFADIDALDDWYASENLELPKWCYGCNVIPFTVSIESALESSSDDMYEDFDYTNESVELEELIDFVEKWNEKQTAKAYDIDYKKIILLKE